LKPNFNRHVPILIAAAVTALVCLLQALPRVYPNFDVLQRLEWMTYDWRARQALSSSSSAATNLGAIFIDDDSLKAINDNFQFAWPWPRQLYGRLVKGFRDAVKIYEVQWREIDEETRSFDAGILTATRVTPPPKLVAPRVH